MSRKPNAWMAKVYLEVDEKLGGGKVLCEQCGATLDTFADTCSADLDQKCQGFAAIDAVRSKAVQKHCPAT